MTRIILDTTVLEILHNLVEPLELCDKTGQVRARLTPIYDLAEFGPLEPQISEEEIRRREQSDKWYTTEQVLAHLKNLEQQ